MAHKVALTLIVLFLPALALAEAVTFYCDYTSYSDEEGNHEVKDKFVLTFLVDGDNAYIIGNNGSEPVEVVAGDGKVSFIEITATGNLMTTAITADGKSVHSRNSIMFGDLIPSQYYGTCESR